ncbi:MAG: peroxiredoxin [Gammaproteobacteria bacterium]|nr:MAG: peroxiredoxin [Gammaproteobacteria bacterium]
MSELAIGKAAPAFSAPATGDKTLSLADFAGKTLVLYFYPKDNTPGCTTEGQDFAAHHAKFKRAGAAIVGVSRDSLRAHENFRAKYDFPFDLISDKDEALCQAFGVIKEKNMYGRKVLGIERSTFVIDAEGVLRHAWRGVKVKGHVEEVLAAVKAL